MGSGAVVVGGRVCILRQRGREERGVEDRIDAFLRYMATERGSARNTIVSYRTDLIGFAALVVPSSKSDSISIVADIDGEMIARYVEWLDGRDYAPATVARKMASVRSFCAYLLARGELAENPAERLEAPRDRGAMPVALSTQEVDSLLRQPLIAGTPEALRDAGMLELMYATGMRVTEFVSLNLGQLHLQPRPGVVRCAGKGERERVLPVRDRAADVVERYLTDARPALLKGRLQEALFVNRRGARLTRQGFWGILKHYALAAGVESHVTPRVLRDSFAIHMLNGGTSVEDVQALLGHANAARAHRYAESAATDPSK